MNTLVIVEAGSTHDMEWKQAAWNYVERTALHYYASNNVSHVPVQTLVEAVCG